MTDDIQLTISGKRFTLTRAEAEFLAEHLRTAIAQPNLACTSPITDLGSDWRDRVDAWHSHHLDRLLRRP